MPFWTYQNLAAVTAGQWLVPPTDETATIPAAEHPTGPILWHDSREITPGQVYLALTGENFDGHDFVDQAFNAGAALAIVQSEAAVSPQLSAYSQRQQPILLVKDSEKALQQLARAYRHELRSGGCQVIGIAGSNGKTTTRHLIHHVLTHAGKTGTQSPKSFNNHLGVPLTLLAARPTDDFVAAEIGTNHPGEIDFLAEIVKPDIAVITSIGEEHLEFFKDLEGVAKEELSIANHLHSSGLLITGDLDGYESGLPQYGLSASNIVAAKHSSLKLPSDIPLQGKHNRTNAMVACMVASHLGVDELACGYALRSARPAPHRGELIKLNDDVKIYDDCYNANPSSMREALLVLGEIADEASVVIFGDMLELGSNGPEQHRKIGELVVKLNPRRFVTIGPLARHAFDAAVKTVFSHHFDEWSDTLASDMACMISPGDTVLLKASRGMRLERLIPAIELRFGRAE